MADISKITLPNGSSYNIKDATARSGLAEKAEASHTHNYAGSTSAGGAANSAINSTYSDYINLIASNEIRFNKRPTDSTDIYFNYIWADGTADAKINNYVFDNGNKSLANIQAAKFIGELEGNSDTVDGKHASDFAAASHTHTKSQITDFPTSLPANGGNADTVNNHTVNADVPADAVFTDTVPDLSLYALKSKYGDTTINVGRKADTTIGTYSTAEGYYTTATGVSSHAEGQDTTASGTCSHAEGQHTTASGLGSHAEGSKTKSSGKLLPDRTVTISNVSYTITGSTAYGINSHAEGTQSFAKGYSSHAEGYQTTASGEYSHAEGQGTTASGVCSHAEGQGTKASFNFSHAEGFQTTASGNDSHAEGNSTTASNSCSHAGGHYNAAMTTGGSSSNTTGTAFVIGNGTNSKALANAFSVQFNGTVKAKSTITASTTADYAEFFEWIDENPDEEDRVGYFVTLDGDKIRIATAADDYILGVVSGEPFVLGNGDCDTWNGMFLRDEFRRTIYEPAPKMAEILDSEGNSTGEFEEVEGEFEGIRPKLNPEYDHTQKYISRFDRKEWAPIGMLGVLAVRHDGTAQVNGYVTVNADGIATACEKSAENAYRVIKSNTDSVVEIIFR